MLRYLDQAQKGDIKINGKEREKERRFNFVRLVLSGDIYYKDSTVVFCILIGWYHDWTLIRS